ncbi:hypothetical protein BGX38DRAFT_1215062, partial [Terfezia claveryi]
MMICVRPCTRISPLKTSLIVFLGSSALQSSRSESSISSDDLFHFQRLRSGACMFLKLLGPWMIMSSFRSATDCCVSITTLKALL